MRSISLLILLCSITQAFGQNGLTEGLAFLGKVVDKKTQTGIPFATIAILNRSLGTVSDKDGQFELRLNQVNKDDTIRISSVGYESFVTTVDQFMNRDSIVELSMESVILDDVTISKTGLNLDINSFMREVLENYKSLKRSTGHIAKSQVLESAKLNGKYIMYNEAIGYSVYMGVNNTYAALANFQFYPETIRKSNPAQEWLDYRKHLPSSSLYSDVLYGGSLTLNCFRLVEIKGVLANRESKYSYKLLNTYSEGSKKVFVVQFKGFVDRGIIEVYGNNLQIKSLKCHGEYLWSTAYHTRVIGDCRITFNYFDNQPFINEISAFYKKGKLVHSYQLKNLIQKYNEFEFGDNEIGMLTRVGTHPQVIYDSIIWNSTESLSEDFDKIENDLSRSGETIEDQFLYNSGSLYTRSEKNNMPSEKQNEFYAEAEKLINSLTVIF